MWAKICTQNYIYQRHHYTAWRRPSHRRIRKRRPLAWLRARDVALTEVSLVEFGLMPGAQERTPATMFKLHEFANHSNFPECPDCREFRLEKLENIRVRAPAAKRAQTRAKAVAHVQECHAERHVCSDLETEASRNPRMLFGLTDKLGSHWNYIPIARDGRESKATSSRWKCALLLSSPLPPSHRPPHAHRPPAIKSHW
jgi:hypothetical protein